MITVIDKDKRLHNGRLLIRNVDVVDVECDITSIVSALEDYNFELALDFCETLISDIMAYQEEYDREYLRDLKYGVDFDEQDFIKGGRR